MNGKYLLDTNIVIGILNNDKEILKKLTSSEEIHISDVVIGELYFGMFGSKKKDENLTKIEKFISQSSIKNINTKTAQNYGFIKNFLKENGTPIPDNDIWIAAIAKQNDLTVLTRDNHFKTLEIVLVEFV